MPAAARAATAVTHPKDAIGSGARRLWPHDAGLMPGPALRWLSRRAWGLAAAAGIGIAATAPWPLTAALLLALIGLRREHQVRRRLQELALLNQLNHLTDPRSSTDAALQQLLRATRAFFKARRCCLVLTDPKPPMAPGSLGGRRRRSEMGENRGSLGSADEPRVGPWAREAMLGEAGFSAIAAGALSAAQAPRPAPDEHQICVPLVLPAGPAQLQLSSLTPISPANASFLAEVAERIASLADRSDQVERRVQEAARRVRHRVALDLHDSAIQPYIGLKLAVEALCIQARTGRSLEAELNRISAMASQVIEDLQGCRRQISDPNTGAPPLLGEIERQAQLMQQFHGVHIAVKAFKEPPVSDRLRTEVLHMVREGLSNIRRHTRARTGEVQLDCDGAWLALRIANEGAPDTFGFTPRSISDRAATLGGRVQVCHEPHGRTAVRIEIPVDHMAAP